MNEFEKIMVLGFGIDKFEEEKRICDVIRCDRNSTDAEKTNATNRSVELDNIRKALIDKRDDLIKTTAVQIAEYSVNAG